jgi:hypothetical protein
VAFAGVYDYFKNFYCDLEATEGARTHCSDLKRDVGRITFKLPVCLGTDVGKWSQACQELNLALLEDVSYMRDYRENCELLNTNLNEIQGLLQQGKEEDALTGYQELRNDRSRDLDYLNDCINRMKKSDLYFREMVG